MTNEQIIAEAILNIESKPGYHYSRKAVEDCVNAGLIPGEVIIVDDRQRINVSDDCSVVFRRLVGDVWQDIPIKPGAEDRAKAMALKIKAIVKSQLASESGSSASFGRSAYPGGYTGGL